MPSPFPGMDPFIEASGRWEDFHFKLIAALEQTLGSLLPNPYYVSVGERFYVILSSKSGDQRHGGQTVVSVQAPPGTWLPGNAPASTVAVAETQDGSIPMRAFVEEEFREHFVEIREAGTGRLITVVEVLSPSNKRFDPEGWRQYLRKRQSYLEEDSINFVEIDLVRSGQRMPMHDPWPAGPYYILLKRRWQGRQCRVWPASSLRPLPLLVVPLAEPDADLQVPLQPLVDAIYERSRYHLLIDYRQAPRPPLETSEEQWLQERLREQPVQP